MNVIDDAKLQAALTGVTDNALRGLVEQVLPVITALVDRTVKTVVDTSEQIVGDALADLTAERQQTMYDLHALLDRLDGVTIKLYVPASTVPGKDTK